MDKSTEKARDKYRYTSKAIDKAKDKARNRARDKAKDKATSNKGQGQGQEQGQGQGQGEGQGQGQGQVQGFGQDQDFLERTTKVHICSPGFFASGVTRRLPLNTRNLGICGDLEMPLNTQNFRNWVPSTSCSQEPGILGFVDT